MNIHLRKFSQIAQKAVEVTANGTVRGIFPNLRHFFRQ